MSLKPHQNRALSRGHVHPLSVAPMMARTDRHFRYLMRQMTRHTLLYTEMVTTNAILHGDTQEFLATAELEHPVSLQLGGDDPRALAACARLAEDHGFDEVNLNVGCPSERVQNGQFGACLMQHPHRVAEGVAAMRSAVRIPVTVKHRIGVDALDRYEDMANFVEIVAGSGCDRFTVHARKAWLHGLSPKENRTVPPLRYEDVYRLKRDYPDLIIEINGGIKTIDQVREHLAHVDGVMIGRSAYETPYIFSTADAMIYGDSSPQVTRREIVHAMAAYAGECAAQGIKLHAITKHLLTLFQGLPGARAWRRALSESCTRPEAEPDVLIRALACVPQDDEPPHSQENRPGPRSMLASHS